MCTGAEMMFIGALAASAGGMAANHMANEDVKGAMSDANDSYTERTNRLQDQNTQNLRDTLDGMTVPKNIEDTESAVDARQEAVRENVKPVASPLEGLPQGGNSVIDDAYQAAALESERAGISMGDRMARMGGWQDNRFLKDLAISRNALETQKLNNFQQGWGTVLQQDLANAQNAGGGKRTLGSILSLTGMGLGLGAGMMGGGLFGLGGADAATKTATAAAASGPVVPGSSGFIMQGGELVKNPAFWGTTGTGSSLAPTITSAGVPGWSVPAARAPFFP